MGMTIPEILRAIWTDEVSADLDPAGEAFTRALSELVPVQWLALRLETPDAPLRVMAEDHELMPALPLGDVLAEELALEVPYGTLALFLPETRDRSRDLGRAVAACLLKVVETGGLPVERETEALFMMAHSATRQAGSRRLRHLDIDQAEFSVGLGATLGAYWCTDRQAAFDRLTLFSRPDFLWQPELRGFLSRLDPSFRAPDPVGLPGDLLHVAGRDLSLAEWVARVETALRDAMGTPRRGWMQPVSSSVMSRFNLQ